MLVSAMNYTLEKRKLGRHVDELKLMHEVRCIVRNDGEFDLKWTEFSVSLETLVFEVTH